MEIIDFLYRTKNIKGLLDLQKEINSKVDDLNDEINEGFDKSHISSDCEIISWMLDDEIDYRDLYQAVGAKVIKTIFEYKDHYSKSITDDIRADNLGGIINLIELSLEETGKCCLPFHYSGNDDASEEIDLIKKSENEYVVRRHINNENLPEVIFTKERDAMKYFVDLFLSM